jgi:hypothetical protein
MKYEKQDQQGKVAFNECDPERSSNTELQASSVSTEIKIFSSCQMRTRIIIKKKRRGIRGRQKQLCKNIA